MRLGICTIQRDRGRWLAEWVAFHHLVGFRKFYIYLHQCKDDSHQVVASLMKHFDITCFTLDETVERPQLAAYQHAYTNHGDEVDWMAFVDGDEFLFSPKYKHIGDALDPFNYEKVSAIGAWWVCFSSSGHVAEPEGLIIQNYMYRPELSHDENKHFKSIVRGRQGDHFSILINAHHFKTLHGTFDEKMTPLEIGKMPDATPSLELFRINHYISQSYEFFKNFKQHSGAADAGKHMVRDEAFWRIVADDNAVYDDVIHMHLDDLKKMLSSLDL